MKRELVDRVRDEWRVSIRRACSILCVDRALYVYKSQRGMQAELKHRIKEICETRVLYGYRRVHVLLRRDGWAVNPKRVYRLYKELGLQLRNKVPKRRVKAKLREDRCPATHSNQTWAMDFVHDQLATGRKIRILTVSIPSHASLQRSIPASVIGEKTSSRRWSESAGALAIRKQSGSTTAVSSSAGISICGPTRRMSCSTSHDQANRLTTVSSRALTASSAPSA